MTAVSLPNLFCCSWTFFFWQRKWNRYFYYTWHPVHVQCQRTSSEAAGSHYCSLCIFTCTYWNYQYFVEAYPV